MDKKKFKMKSNSQRAWCFTSFQEDLKYDPDVVRYIIIGREVCPTTQKKHLQGYVEFRAKVTLRKAQVHIGDTTAHMEKRMGTRDQAREYCKKDGKFDEFGCWESGGQGARTDILEGHRENCQQILDWINEGLSDYDILLKEPAFVYKYQQFIRRTRSILEEEDAKNAMLSFQKMELNDLQKELSAKVEAQNERKVTWVYDPTGNSGKTWWSKHMLAQGDTIRLENGKTKDIAYAYNGEGTVIFDFSRTLEGRVNYQVIESIKNGLLFSGKYESKSKVFSPPKVIILANFPPDYGALSKDRWDMVYVGRIPEHHRLMEA